MYIMYQQLWGYKVEEKLYLGVCEQKTLNTTALEHWLHVLLGLPYVLLSAVRDVSTLRCLEVGMICSWY
jgi:hypothetical protein